MPWHPDASRASGAASARDTVRRHATTVLVHNRPRAASGRCDPSLTLPGRGQVIRGADRTEALVEPLLFPWWKYVGAITLLRFKAA